MLDKFRETAITWDKANRKVYEPLRVSAGDNKGRKLSVQVVNGGVIEDLSGASLSLFWETKDKAHKGLDAFTAVDATKGKFEIYYTTGMLSNEGVLNANLVLVDTSGRVVSEPFTITVFRGIDDDAIQSEDSFTALTEALAQVGNINNKADRVELLELESTFEQTKVSLEQQLAQTDSRIADIILTNDLDPNKDPEVVDARFGEPTLGSKIWTIDDKLNNVVQGENTEKNIKIDTTLTSGFVATNGTVNESTSYVYTKRISVLEGDRITVTADGISQFMRFVCAYVGDVADSLKGSSSDIKEYVVPEGVTEIIVTAESRFQNLLIFMIKRNVVEYSLKGLSEIDTRVQSLENTIIRNVDNKKFVFTAETALLSSEATLTVAQRIDNKKNCSYLLNANFNDFDTVTLGHGYRSFGGSYITVDNVNVTAYYYNGSKPVVMGTYAHGLTISDFIHVNVKVGDVANLRAVITMMTKGGEFSVSNVPFAGCNGDVFVLATMDMSSVKSQYVVNDMKHDVFIFGDSYLSLGDPNRYPHHLMVKGYTKMLLSGFSGATSLTEIISFRNILTIQKPSYVVWTLGMNDADTTTTYNTNWKTCLDEVISVCDTNGIELILATIPNTPKISNVYKNEFVRNSGYRYVDFAKAVHAEDFGASWYPGMLSTDNVHPTELGAKALANRFLIDVPEIIS